MLKKLRLPLEIGQKAYFISSLAKSGEPPQWVSLDYYVVKNGRIEWQMTTSRGHTILGTVREERPLMLFKDSWAAVAIPVTLHLKTGGLSPDFIFGVPGFVNIQKDPNRKS